MQDEGMCVCGGGEGCPTKRCLAAVSPTWSLGWPKVFRGDFGMALACVAVRRRGKI